MWTKVRVTVTDATREAIINFLFDSGAVGCEEQKDHVVGYFSRWSSNNLTALKRYLFSLAELGFQCQPEGIQMDLLKDQDWSQGWKKTLQPILVSDRIVVKPTWVPYQPPGNPIVIEIDPQMAFGTGSHPTTILVLRLMETLIGGRNKVGKVLDVGTGTGILAIAAVKLNVAQVIALDKDPVAIETARQNLTHNHVAERVHLILGTPDCIKNGSFDLVLANLNSTEIIKLLKNNVEHFLVTGVYIVSGILLEEEAEVIGKIKELGFTILTKEVQDEWLSLVLQRPCSFGFEIWTNS